MKMNNKKRIFKVLKSALHEKNVDETTSQKNTNQWDSLKHLSLVVELEIEFNIEFEPDEIAKMIDYTKIEEYINKKI
jgi:acyl carrier protein